MWACSCAITSCVFRYCAVLAVTVFTAAFFFAVCLFGEKLRKVLLKPTGSALANKVLLIQRARCEWKRGTSWSVNVICEWRAHTPTSPWPIAIPATFWYATPLLAKMGARYKFYNLVPTLTHISRRCGLGSRRGGSSGLSCAPQSST